MFGLKNK